MSNMCTCHICPDSCEWCRLQKVKQIFTSLKSQHPAIKDVLWAVNRLEDYMIADANKPEDWEGGSFAEQPQFTAVDFLKGLEGFESRCGSCKFLSSGDTSICTKHGKLVTNTSPACPDWRYFA